MHPIVLINSIKPRCVHDTYATYTEDDVRYDPSIKGLVVLLGETM